MMDYEKKYKDALERAREFQKSKDGLCVLTAESIFPELNESEDEKIRKELIFYLGDMPEDTELRNGVTNRDVLSWLEKQGEHDETSIAIKNPEAYRIGFADGEAHAKEEMNTLSDEDKMMLNELIIGFYGYKDQYPNFWKMRTDEIIEWLKKKKDERTTDNR